MTFEATSPGIQSDTYAFPSTLETTSGVATGPTWIGDQDVQESFSVGLTVVVNPSNPGNGGSTPTVSCSQCAFSGSTIDFGAITAGNFVPGGDVVRASVIYTGSTVAANWTLTVSTNLNPACTGTCQGTNELLTGVDQTASNGPSGTGTCNGAIASSIGVPTPTTAVLLGSPAVDGRNRSREEMQAAERLRRHPEHGSARQRKTPSPCTSSPGTAAVHADPVAFACESAPDRARPRLRGGRASCRASRTSAPNR